MNDVQVREVAPEDLDGVRAVHDLAFGGAAEGQLVRRLTEDGLAIVSLVAVEPVTARILGHVLFSELPLVTVDRHIRAASLAPFAVLPDRQRRGIGTELVRRGLQLCRERSVEAVLVLGDPAYYARFGFSVALGELVRSLYQGPHFMALELTRGALPPGCEARYPAAFSDLG